MTAHYAGDDNHTASHGEAVAIVIGKATAAITVVSYSTPTTATPTRRPARPPASAAPT